MRDLHSRRANQLAEGTDPTPAPRPNSWLVDEELTPAAEQAARATAMSLIPQLSRRAAAVFLGDEHYQKITHVRTETVAFLMIDCLRRFIHSRGGQVTLACRIDDRGVVLNPIQTTVRVDGKARQVLRVGHVFAHFPDGGVVVSVDPCSYPGSSAVALLVRSATSPAKFWCEWEDYARGHNYLRGKAFFADGQPIERRRRYTWEDILLPVGTKKVIQVQVEGFLRDRDELRRLGVKPRRGLILAGPPGTGKTLLGKVLADTLDVSFLWVSPRHVKNAASFEDLLSVARFVAPAVVFLEDLDLFAGDREEGGSAVLGELMNQLDGAVDNEDIVTIATTNRLDVIERALRNRPGRFDRIVSMDVMDPVCRQVLFQGALQEASITDDDMAYLVELTEDYTGAQAQELSNTLFILALDRDRTHGVLECNTEAGLPDRIPDGKMVRMDRALIDAAVEEVNVERRARMGFHVA